MIVYGDAAYQTDLAGLLGQLTGALEQARLEPDLASLRYWLILAGQVEQAVFDAWPSRFPEAVTVRRLAGFRRLTALAASAFYKSWRTCGQAAQAENKIRRLIEIESGERLLRNLRQNLPGRVELEVKAPEGYAFYALYPDQYCQAAQSWLADHQTQPRERVAVVGIRSIGTGLAALVAAALAAAGWPAHSLTVRPAGHPYSRETALDPADLRNAQWAIVVDEGPGLSGSSMTSVAAALTRCGLELPAIAFMPGHPGLPGSAASPQTLALWAAVARYVTPSDETIIAGRTLEAGLAEATRQITGCPEPITTETVGGGGWRARVYERPEHWPPAYAAFEPPAFLCRSPAGPDLLWTFYGLAAVADGPGAADQTYARLLARARAGFGPPPLGSYHGFIACRWLEGRSFTLADLDDTLLADLGCYLAAVSGPSLSQPEQDQATGRLREMLYWNTWEILGEAAAEATRNFKAGQHYGAGSYGDGYLAPSEWRRGPDNRLVKANMTRLGVGPTCIGRQPVYWDLAGAQVEWQLEPDRFNDLLESFEIHSREKIRRPELAFYAAAYAAFKAGQAHMCAGQTGDPDEQARLWAAFNLYKAALAGYIEARPSAG